MSREEKLREIAEQEQALMREIYGFDNGVAWERERIIKLLENPLFHFLIGSEQVVLKGQPPQSTIQWIHADSCSGCYAIALIKGERQKDNESVVFSAEGEQVSEQIKQKIELLNNFGRAIRNNWSDIDGRSIRSCLNTFVDWVTDDGETFNREKGLDILGVCQGCGVSWENDCWDCEKRRTNEAPHDA